MGKPAVAIELTVDERRDLEGLAGRRRTAQGLARRARIVLLAADGLENQEICADWMSIRTPLESGVAGMRSVGLRG